MESYAAVLSIAIPGFVVLIIIEAIVARIKGIEINNSFDFISSMSSGMTNTLKDLMGLSIVIISYGWMENAFGLFDIQSNVLLYALAFIGLDFAGYWSHRFNHKINLFWNRHIIHHSSEEFNLACALRQPISNLIGIYFFLYVPMALLGVPQKIVAITAPLHLFAQFWYHTRLINKMGILEHLLVTPSHHRVHHAINPEYIDKNFSQIFIVWDKWFGTFQEEIKGTEAVYGIKRPANSWNPLIINFMHVWLLIKDAWRTNSWRDKILIWFKPTGWRPDDVKEKYPVDAIEDINTYQKYQGRQSKSALYFAWFQFVTNVAILYYLLMTIGDYSILGILTYGAFVMTSIFSYTSMMDGHRLAFVFEIIKIVFAGLVFYNYKSWYNIESTIPQGNLLLVVYLVLSILGTFLILQKDYRDSSKRFETSH